MNTTMDGWVRTVLHGLGHCPDGIMDRLGSSVEIGQGNPQVVRP